jgi:flagellar motor component MotA
MAYIGAVILVFSLAFGFVSERLLDAPSIIIVVVGSVFIALYAFGRDLSSVWRALAAPEPSAALALTAICVLRSGRSFAVAVGVTGTLSGMTIMLFNMDDPSQLSAGMAIATLTQIYGILLGFVVLTPLIGAVRRKHSPTSGEA